MYSYTSSFHHRVSLSPILCPDDIPNTSLPGSSSRPSKAYRNLSLKSSKHFSSFSFHQYIIYVCSLPHQHSHPIHYHPILSGYTLSCHYLPVSNHFKIASSTHNVVHLCALDVTLICQPLFFPLKSRYSPKSFPFFLKNPLPSVLPGSFTSYQTFQSPPHHLCSYHQHSH